MPSTIQNHSTYIAKQLEASLFSAQHASCHLNQRKTAWSSSVTLGTQRNLQGQSAVQTSLTIPRYLKWGALKDKLGTNCSKITFCTAVQYLDQEKIQVP
jgi:hypothetical protein